VSSIVKVKVLGATELRAKLARVGQNVPKFVLSQKGLGALLIREMKKRFRQQVDPSGKPWKPLNKRSRKGRRLLYQTGSLYDAIGVIEGGEATGFASPTGAGFRIGIKSKKRMERSAAGRYSRQVDTAVYGRVHQLGQNGIPQRRFIGLSASDRVLVAQFMKQQLKRALAVS
jgi:phage gpG-like protein